MSKTSLDNDTAIQIKNLSKTFGHVKALNGISLTINKNEVLGLLGPNGSGKTTLMRILATLTKPDSPKHKGAPYTSCKVLEYDLLKERDKIKEIIGYVPQQDALYADLSAEDNVIFFSAPYASNGKKKNAEELLKKVNLLHRKKDIVKTFSGGMVKRLSITCSLAHNPSIILLDEATVGLDAQTRQDVWDIINDLKRESTVIVTTHYTPEAEQNCDRVAWIFQGEVLDLGSPAELIRKHPKAKNLDEAMSFSQQIKAAKDIKAKGATLHSSEDDSAAQKKKKRTTSQHGINLES